MRTTVCTLLLLTFLSSYDALRLVPTRRIMVQGALACTTSSLLSSPVHAAEGDKLIARLQEASQQLATTKNSLADGDWDTVRAAVKGASTPLTMKGYLGESVKSRALETGSEELAAARKELLKSLGTLDRYCYDRQMGKSSSLNPSEALDQSIENISSIVRLLGS